MTKKGINVNNPTQDDVLLDTLAEMDLLHEQGTEVMHLQIKHLRQALVLKNQIVDKKDQIIDGQEEIIKALTAKLREHYIKDEEQEETVRVSDRPRLPEKKTHTKGK